MTSFCIYMVIGIVWAYIDLKDAFSDPDGGFIEAMNDASEISQYGPAIFVLLAVLIVSILWPIGVAAYLLGYFFSEDDDEDDDDFGGPHEDKAWQG